MNQKIQTKVIPCTEETLNNGEFENKINEFLSLHGHQLTDRGMMTFADKAIFYYDENFEIKEVPEMGTIEAKKLWLEQQLDAAKKLMFEAEWLLDTKLYDQDNLQGLSQTQIDAKLGSIEESKKAFAERKKEAEFYQKLIDRIDNNA